MKNGWRQCVAASLVCGLFAGASWADDEVERKVRKKFRVVVGEKQDEKEATPRDWIGLSLSPPSDALAAHLQLTGGMLVAEVMEGSPAQKAGLQLHDIIVRFNGKKIDSHEDILKAVADAKRKECPVEVIRQGKTVRVSITPAERPEGVGGHDGGEFRLEFVPGADAPMGNVPGPFRDWLKRAMRGDEKMHRLMMVRPGFAADMLPGFAELKGEWKLHLQRTGDDPPKLRVEHGDEKWEVTGEQIDQLPKEVQGVARRLLGGHGGVFRFEHQVTPRALPEDPLDDIHKELKALRDAVKELQGRE